MRGLPAQVIERAKQHWAATASLQAMSHRVQFAPGSFFKPGACLFNLPQPSTSMGALGANINPPNNIQPTN